MTSTKIINKFILLNSKGENDIIDITNNVNRILLESQLKNGLVTLFVVGSTAAITTLVNYLLFLLIFDMFSLSYL